MLRYYVLKFSSLEGRTGVDEEDYWQRLSGFESLVLKLAYPF